MPHEQQNGPEQNRDIPKLEDAHLSRRPEPSILLHDLLEQAVNAGASDLHLLVGAPPSLRVNGRIAPLPVAPLSAEGATALARELVPARNVEPLSRGEEIDFSYLFEGKKESRMCRGCASMEVKGPTVALRIFPNVLPTPQSTGLPKELIELTGRSEGIIFITGPTGSGKSTTLAAMVNRIATTRACRIVTIEQPVEYRFDKLSGAKALIAQIAVPDNVRSFASALRRSLRQDPDVIMVGEARDFETIETAVNAAHTGHLVLATLHANSAADTVERCISLCADPARRHEFRMMLSTAFLGAFSQRLLPKLDGSGRVMAYELMIRTEKVQELIESGDPKELAAVISSGRSFGMRALDDHLFELAHEEVIELGEALHVAKSPEALRRRLRGFGGG